MKKIDISEIICTRISHDLIGNVGAFANALELLEDDDDEFFVEIKSTLKNSSDVLTARLKFFRIAFGLQSANLERSDLIINTTADYIKTLNPNHPISFEANAYAPSLSKIMMLSTMSVADVVVRGGNINVASDNNTMVVSVNSPSPLSATKIEAINGILNGKMPDNLSLYAPLFYLLEILESTKMNLSIDSNTNSLSFIMHP